MSAGPPRPARLALRLLLAFAVTLAAALGGALAHLARWSVDLPATVVVEVRPGEGLRTLAADLAAKGLVPDRRVFLLMAKWRGIDRRVRHGRHEFTGRQDLKSVMAELASTPRPLLRVAIPEGLTIREVGALLEAAGVVSAEAYRSVACSAEARTVAGAPADAPCAEGWLFPDSYDLLPGMPPGQVVDLQLRRFREVAAPLLAAAASAPLPLEAGAQREAQVLTMASIVEKETASPTERPHVAGVFWNRIRLGMLLQTDPTVIHGVIESGEPWNGDLTRRHLTTDTPWNTYTRRGLPPGPICNPGRAALEAALHPQETRDLYFVARGDGTHEFHETLAEHEAAVARWQLAGKARGEHPAN